MKKLLIWVALLAGMILVFFGVHTVRERRTRVEAMRIESRRLEDIATMELLTSDLSGLLSIKYQIPNSAAKSMAIDYVTRCGGNVLFDFFSLRPAFENTYVLIDKIAADNNVDRGTAAAFLHDLDAWISVRTAIDYQYRIRTD